MIEKNLKLATVKIEIGDIFLRFTQHSEDYQLSDDTAIQITKNPYIK